MRKLIIVLICCTGILLVGYIGYRSYRTWRQNHMLNLAKEFLAKSDSRNALLSISQVLRANPMNVDATRIMAELSEAGQSPSALSWRKRVVELNPHSLNDRIALAQTAMSMMDIATATNALNGVDPADKKKAAFQNVAGVVAAISSEPFNAESHFTEASRLEPQNVTPQFNLAIVRLHGTNAALQNMARMELKSLSSNPTNSNTRCQALRELAVDSMRLKDRPSALEYSRRLITETNASFTDKMLRLSLLMETKDADFKPALASLQAEAATNSSKIYQIATWQMARQSPKESINWLRTMPPKIQTNQPVALLEAECFTMLGDWKSLQATLEKQNWGELEFIRHAFLARALRGQDLTAASKGEWDLSVKSGAGRKNSEVMLLRMAAQWGWDSESEELLWTIVKQYPSEKWATMALTRVFFVTGRTRSLMNLYSQQLKVSPNDLALKNNLAMIALLLDAQEFKPNDLAIDVYRKAPNNSSYVSTYAFSLYLQHKNAEALKIIEQLKPQELQDPSIAGYYGLILRANGNRAKAKNCLESTTKAVLLPEEKRLFEKARSES